MSRVSLSLCACVSVFGNNSVTPLRNPPQQFPENCLAFFRRGKSGSGPGENSLLHPDTLQTSESDTGRGKLCGFGSTRSSGKSQRCSLCLFFFVIVAFLRFSVRTFPFVPTRPSADKYAATSLPAASASLSIACIYTTGGKESEYSFNRAYFLCCVVVVLECPIFLRLGDEFW